LSLPDGFVCSKGFTDGTGLEQKRAALQQMKAELAEVNKALADEALAARISAMTASPYINKIKSELGYDAGQEKAAKTSRPPVSSAEARQIEHSKVMAKLRAKVANMYESEPRGRVRFIRALADSGAPESTNTIAS